MIVECSELRKGTYSEPLEVNCSFCICRKIWRITRIAISIPDHTSITFLYNTKYNLDRMMCEIQDHCEKFKRNWQAKVFKCYIRI